MPDVPNAPAEGPARLLSEVHAARLLARDALSAAARPVTARLWAHARRPPGGAVALDVERAIRTDEAARRRYGAILAALAVAHSPVALAASGGAPVVRRLGGARLELLEGGDGDVPLLALRDLGDPAPSAIELHGRGEIVRLALPAPSGGAAVIALDPALPEAASAAALLRDPATAIFLLP